MTVVFNPDIIAEMRNKIERPALMDCHVHLDEIEIHDPGVANFFGKKVGDVRWPQVSIERHLKHIADDNIDTEYVIYENPDALAKLTRAANCDIRGMYFIRDIRNPDLAQVEKLFSRGLVRALKVHPVVDHFELTSGNLHHVLNIARKFSLPILYHSDDRKDHMKLTSPELQKALAEENSDIIFIIGHGGAYGNSRLVGSKQALSYWYGHSAPYSRSELVLKALTLCLTQDNVFYDLSIATNRIKAKIIADFVNSHPRTAEKIMIGTDFPIHFASAQSQLQALVAAGMKQKFVFQIAANRLS